jgi:hypothetical protein
MIITCSSFPVLHPDKGGLGRRHGGCFDGRHQWLERGIECDHRGSEATEKPDVTAFANLLVADTHRNEK